MEDANEIIVPLEVWDTVSSFWNKICDIKLESFKHLQFLIYFLQPLKLHILDVII